MRKTNSEGVEQHGGSGALTPSFPRLTLPQRALLALLVLGSTLYFNWDSLRSVDFSHHFVQADVAAILEGYRKTPNLLADGLSWWRGPWIQEGIHAFRPLASYLLWLECWFGFRTGFTWIGVPGVALLAVCSLFAAELGLRWTRSYAGACCTALLAPAARHVLMQPPMWMHWFPAHQDLLQCALLLGAVLQFDAWFCLGGRRRLVLSAMLFLAGALTKEFGYVFPALALTFVLLRPATSARRKLGLAVVGSLGLVVLGLWLYRGSVIPHPYNPTLKPLQALDKATMFMYQRPWVLARSEPWVAGLGLLWALLFAFLVRLRRTGARRAWFWTAAAAGLVLTWGYLQITTGAPDVALAMLFSPQAVYGGNLVTQLLVTYQAFMFWKYRKAYPTALAWMVLLLFYAPVLDFIGWHYALPAWFARSAYNVLSLTLAVRDLGLPQLRRLRELRRFPAVAN